LHVSVDQPAIYRTQVKVTEKQNSHGYSGDKENTVDKKPFHIHFNKIYKI